MNERLESKAMAAVRQNRPEPRVLEDQAQMIAELAKLREENARLKAGQRAKGITLKVTDKGGVSAYGLGRFPVTLYLGQWERLLAAKDQIEEFLVANASQLSVKE